VHLDGFIIRKLSRYTVTWTSKFVSLLCAIAHIKVESGLDSIDRYNRSIDANYSIVVLHAQRYSLWTPELVRSHLQYKKNPSPFLMSYGWYCKLKHWDLSKSHLKAYVYYVPSGFKFRVLHSAHTEYYVLFVDLRTKSDYFPLQH